MTTNAEAPKGLLDKFLNAIEVAGNKLPDPAVLFIARPGGRPASASSSTPSPVAPWRTRAST